MRPDSRSCYTTHRQPSRICGSCIRRQMSSGFREETRVGRCRAAHLIGTANAFPVLPLCLLVAAAAQLVQEVCHIGALLDILFTNISAGLPGLIHASLIHACAAQYTCSGKPFGTMVVSAMHTCCCGFGTACAAPAATAVLAVASLNKPLQRSETSCTALPQSVETMRLWAAAPRGTAA